MKIGSLFSGIGGLELGLEWSGLGHTVWQVESSPFCRKVLAKHWPEAKRFEDAKKVGAANLATVDLICGGFPCQPFSTASRGRRVAEDLWSEMRRIVEECRPEWVVAENVQLDPILRAADDIQTLGYETGAFEIPAAVVGAPHQRIRWFLVAHANSNGKSRRTEHAEMAGACRIPSPISWAAYPAPILGVDDGVPHRMDRLKALGNAVVPQCSGVIGLMIQELNRR